MLDLSTWILTGVAVYGAGLSTYNLIIERVKNKKRIKTDLKVGLLTYPNGKTSDAKFILTARNIGNIPVIINPPVIILPYAKQIILNDLESNICFPHELNPQNSCEAWADLKELAKSMKEQGYAGRVKIRIEFRDAVDKRYQSKPFLFYVGEWTK